MLKSSTAVLAVRDVTETADYYCKVLGFKKHWMWGNPPTFGCVGDGKVEIFLSQQPVLAAKVEGHEHFFAVEDVNAVYERHRGAGAEIVEAIENKPWGDREYMVREINGYHLRFSGAVEYERPATATDALPSHIRLENRLPTLEEYVEIAGSVDWAVEEQPMREALARSLVGVVAIDARDNSAVGMVRCMGGGKYFIIWDVIVKPSHQGQKIGKTMMKRLLDELRKRAPAGSFVGLFTGKPKFYEEVGFKEILGMSTSL